MLLQNYIVNVRCLQLRNAACEPSYQAIHGRTQPAGLEGIEARFGLLPGLAISEPSDELIWIKSGGQVFIDG